MDARSKQSLKLVGGAALAGLAWWLYDDYRSRKSREIFLGMFGVAPEDRARAAAAQQDATNFRAGFGVYPIRTY